MSAENRSPPPADDGPAAPGHRVHRLLLSGGGHRASLGALGAVAALVRSDAWAGVGEVISVSGGSVTNVAVATAGHHDPPDRDDRSRTLAALAALYRRIGRDRARPWSTPRRRLLVLVGVATAAAVVTTVVVLAGAAGPDLPRPLVLAGGAALVPVALHAARLVAHAALADVVTTFAGVASDGHGDLPRGLTRHHVVVATGLDSAQPYHFSWGPLPRDLPSVVTTTRRGVVVRDRFPPADALVASVSLPGLARRRTPVELGREILVDGGVSGVFGVQLDGPGGSAAADRPRQLVVDAARHVRRPGRLALAVQAASLLVRLGRWLQLSLETSYVDDLAELQSEGLVRICTPVVASGTDPVDVALDRDRAETARLSLLGLDPTRIRTAVLAAYVGSLEVLGSPTGDDHRGDVAWLAHTLHDPGLEIRWRELLAPPT